MRGCCYKSRGDLKSLELLLLETLRELLQTDNLRELKLFNLAELKLLEKLSVFYIQPPLMHTLMEI